MTKKFMVRVGGWRPVGIFTTEEEAMAKAKSCISSMVEVIEIEEGKNVRKAEG